MCNCINKSAFKEEKDGETLLKTGNWSDLEGIRKKKRLLDEKYADIDMKLGVNPLKREKKTAKIQNDNNHN